METRETITLDRRVQQRLYILNHVRADELTVGAAAQVIDLSIRQTRRLIVIEQLRLPEPLPETGELVARRARLQAFDQATRTGLVITT